MLPDEVSTEYLGHDHISSSTADHDPVIVGLTFGGPNK
jgi:hypothetical protein